MKIDTNKPKPSPYILEVGDLSDIATITTPAEFNAQLELEFPDGSHA